MSQYDIAGAVSSDLTNAVTDYSVDTATTDGVQDQKETTWTDEDYAQNLGYYKNIPEIAAVIDVKATWTVGKGFEADEDTTFVLDKIRGNSKDTFNTILENLARTKEISGNAYAEIIRDDDGMLINLKPLDPSVMRHVVNRQGMLIRFEQLSKTKGDNPKKFQVEDIFYLARNRVADEIHGTGIVGVLANIILMKNEAMTDQKTLMHRHVNPRMVYRLDTDDPIKIAAFKAKEDAANANRENIYIPKDAVEMEVLSVAPNATLNPLPWIQYLDEAFFQAAQVPKIVVGGAGGLTEAAVKIAYLAFQQTIEEEQLYIEEQVGMQLGIDLDLEFPASLENELLSDNKKDKETGATQPNDTTAGGVQQ